MLVQVRTFLVDQRVRVHALSVYVTPDTFGGEG
jgi:hypothetical protein